MGAFRSKPLIDKYSKDEENDNLRCAVSTMQGWRLTQEDAYNFILDYDKETSYFAVYDGHGGHEVAEYLSTNLPEFLKNMESYKAGDIEKTFIDGFLQMDASLNTPEVMNILNELAVGHEEDDDENIDTLYEEASMPVEKVLQKYREGDSEASQKSSEVDSSTKSDVNEGAGCSKGSSRGERARRNLTKRLSESSEVNDKDVKSGNSTSESEQLAEKGEQSTDVSDSVKDSGSKTEEENTSVNRLQNGDASADEDQAKNCENSENSTDEIGKGKGKAIAKRITPITIDKNCTKPVKSDEEIYKMFLKRYVEREEETEDSDDVSESSNEESSDGQEGESEDQQEETADDDDDGSEEEEEEGDDDVEEYEEIDDDDDDDSKPGRDFELEKPGIKSGSTGVVAMLKGNQLYVANVGDSRCVVCREGKAVPMSFDHKGRDKTEYERIEKAGGRVDCEERVDGGLNMTRAFGDHFYKSNKELSQTEQLIIALPDVKTLTIDPNKDEFMVLASDGIWDVKRKGQDVIDFLRPRIAACEGRLSSVIEELFDECLGKNLFSHGSDNMTLILVQFKSNLSKRSTSPLSDKPAKKLKSDTSEDVVVEGVTEENPSVNC